MSDTAENKSFCKEFALSINQKSNIDNQKSIECDDSGIIEIRTIVAHSLFIFMEKNPNVRDQDIFRLTFMNRQVSHFGIYVVASQQN